MKSLHLFLPFVTAVAAVDVRIWPQTGCSGSYHVICTNLNPNVCCSASDVENWDWHSAAFYGINPSWNINYRAHGGGRCRTLVMSQTVEFGNFWCLGDRGDAITVTGAGYSFVNRRRRSTGDEAQACARADTLVFEDGSKYNLTSLDDVTFTSLMKDVANGAGPAIDNLAEIRVE
ncbi:hypothetical protein B0T18DRAFT_446270 [Schizothecium vesticola]|uniref:Uncharacterized protein n=1 Tax=Schizothecium vesticola TaxID=314040 RepID=A0AA40ETX8_9PEZI|nr:hypothetical protein B0T18DRAFT_446270 [Schizothecium vesticola]